MTRNLWVLISLFSAASAGADVNCKDYSRYRNVTKKELGEMVAKKSALIVDVNGHSTYHGGHVPGAIHYASNKEKFASLLPQDKNALIVAYCGSHLCTAWRKAAVEACQLGYTNVRHFKEGTRGWFN